MSGTSDSSRHPPLGDADARDAIVADLDTSMLVEAGAGSGKTTSMVARMVALLAEGKCRIETLAAVTFTRKAAAHLRAQFQTRLETSFRRECDDTRRERLDAALRALERCFIGTIHSFCALLLRERPIEARMDPSFSAIDNAEDTLIARRVFHDHLQSLHLDDSEVLKDLDRLGIAPGDLYRTYRRVVRYPEIPIVTEPTPAPDFTRARIAVERFLDAAASALPRRIPPRGWDELQKAVHRARRLCSEGTTDDPVRFVRILSALDRSASPIQNRWPDKSAAKQLGEDFSELRESEVCPALRAWWTHCHSYQMALIEPAAERCRAERIRWARLNFQDLLLISADMLRTRPEVREYFQGRYTHLLIDEFQDTDPVQAEVMLYLTGEDARETDWRKLRPRPGSLFVVGDPKQSIYRFRRADIDTYNAVKRQISMTGGRLLELTMNFRTLGKTCDWINGAFRSILEAGESSRQAPFAELVPFRPAGGGDAGVRVLEVPRVYRHGAKKAAEAESKIIATWIRRAVDSGFRLEDNGPESGCRPLRPRDVLIICPQRKHLAVYARELERLGIPFELTGGNSFRESEELGNLLSFLRCVADPGDSISLVAYLRGPLCGVSDDVLYRFRRAGGRLHFQSSLPAALDDEVAATIGRAFESLRSASRAANQLPAAAALESVIQDLGLLPDALVRELGDTRAGNLLKTVEIARARASDAASFADLVEYIADVVEDEDDEYEFDEMSVDPAPADAVRIMNLHQARGAGRLGDRRLQDRRRRRWHRAAGRALRASGSGLSRELDEDHRGDREGGGALLRGDR